MTCGRRITSGSGGEFPGLVRQIVETPPSVPTVDRLVENYSGMRFEHAMSSAIRDTKEIRKLARILHSSVGHSVHSAIARHSDDDVLPFFRSHPRWTASLYDKDWYMEPFEYVPRIEGVLSKEAAFVVRTMHPITLANQAAMLARAVLDIANDDRSTFYEESWSGLVILDKSQPALAEELLAECEALFANSRERAGIVDVPIVDAVRSQVWAGPFVMDTALMRSQDGAVLAGACL